MAFDFCQHPLSLTCEFRFSQKLAPTVSEISLVAGETWPRFSGCSTLFSEELRPRGPFA